MDNFKKDIKKQNEEELIKKIDKISKEIILIYDEHKKHKEDDDLSK